MISVIGRRNLIISGLLLMGTSFIAFGMLTEIENKSVFITLVLLNRFLQGFSSSMVQTTMYSISTNFFPNHKDAMIGYIEAVTGVGLIIGPLVGSALYSIGGYRFAFCVYGAIFFFCSTLIKSVFSDAIDSPNHTPESSPLPVDMNDDYVL